MEYVYSLFGDGQLGYRRFLYDEYLKVDHPDQGIRFELTAEKLKHLNEKARKMAFQIEDTLKWIIHGRVWPVDRVLIMSTVYCFLNARERVRCLLEIHPPGELHFSTSHSLPSCRPADSVNSYISQITPEMYEKVVTSFLRSSGVEIDHKSTQRTPLKQDWANMSSIVSWSKGMFFDLVTRYRFLRGLIVFKKERNRNNTKPSFLFLNGYLGSKDLELCHQCANVLDLDGWRDTSASHFKRKMVGFIQSSNKQTARKQWEKALQAIPLSDEDAPLMEVLPLIAASYPVSLIEGRTYLRGNAREFLRRIGYNRPDGTHIVLNIDHRLWKYETLSALANEIIENRGKVVGFSHDTVTGLLNYGLTLTLDQCLMSHYLGNFKNPFIEVEKETPEVIQVDSLRRFTHSSGGKERTPHTWNVWYFPHYMMNKPKFHCWSYGMDNPESFFLLHKTAMMAFENLAGHPKLKEIVVKLKYAPDQTREKQKFMEFIENLIGNQTSKKMRFVSDATMQQAIPHISIAVHDFFSGGFVETMYADVPTLAILPPEADVPYRLPNRKEWIKSGLFVRNADELCGSLCKLMEGWLPSNYERMRESFLKTCGLGSPTPGEALKSILTELN